MRNSKACGRGGEGKNPSGPGHSELFEVSTGMQSSNLGQRETPEFSVICIWNRIGLNVDADDQRLFKAINQSMSCMQLGKLMMT